MPAAPAAPTAPPPPAPAPAKPSAPAAPMPAPKPTTAPSASPLGLKSDTSMEKTLGMLGKAEPHTKPGARPVPKREPATPKEPEKKADPPEPPKEPEKAVEPEKPADEPTLEPSAEEPAAEEQPGKTEDGKKQSPWKLVNTYKAENSTLKTKVAELERQLGDFKAKPAEDFSGKLTDLQKRYDEAQNELRFTRYERSDEFVGQFHQPYEEAFARAVEGTKGLQMVMPDGETRAIDADDIAYFAQLPPDRARVEIKAKFPDDHAEVRDYVKEVKRLADLRRSALDSAKTKGAERDQALQQSYRALSDENGSLFSKHNSAITEKFDFLKQIEGDDEHNGKLESATKMVDDTLQKNAYDPRLSKEQREQIIKDQASIRARAISYSTLKLKLNRMEKENAELKKSLAEFQKSEPGDGDGGGRATTPAANGGGMDGALDRLGGYARR